MSTNSTVIQYNGIVSNEIVQSILLIIEECLKDNKSKKRVYNLLVESLQNLVRHTEDQFKDISFKLEKDNSKYYIHTQNIINNNSITNLKSKIDYINNLSEEDITNVWKQTLNNGLISEKGGAGLGLMDIKRKSKNKLNYQFKEVDNNWSLFELTIISSEE